MFCPVFFQEIRLSVFAVYLCKYKVFINILISSLNTMLFVDKHCNDICCDEFLMPQIDHKTVTWKILFTVGMEKDSIFQTPKKSKFV